MTLKAFKTKLEILLGDEHPEDVMEFSPVTLVLTNGDMLIAAVGIIDDENLCLMRPYKLVQTGTVSDTMRMTIMRYVPASDDTFFHISYSNVASMGYLEAGVFELYVKAIDKAIAEEDEMFAEELEEAKKESPEEFGNVLAFKPKILH